MSTKSTASGEKYHAFKIRVSADRKDNFVELDGARLKAVAAVEVKVDAALGRKMSQVTLRFNTPDVELEAKGLALSEVEAQGLEKGKENHG